MSKDDHSTGEMQIFRAGSGEAIKGPGEWFTGNVRIDKVFRRRLPRVWAWRL